MQSPTPDMPEPESAEDADDQPGEQAAVLLPGNIALREWFQEKRGRRGGLAAALGVSTGTVSGWGRQNKPTRPHDPVHLFAIEKLADIPLAAWLSPQELEALAPVLDNWQDHIYVPQHRRQAVDPRQVHFDELLARMAEQGASAAAQPPALAVAAVDAPQTEEEDELLDVDAMMGDAS